MFSYIVIELSLSFFPYMSECNMLAFTVSYSKCYHVNDASDTVCVDVWGMHGVVLMCDHVSRLQLP